MPIGTLPDNSNNVPSEVSGVVDTVIGVVSGTRTGILATRTNTMLNADVVVARGALTANDGGGGTFRWTSDTTTADDGGTVIVPNVSGWVRTGCWKRIFSGGLDPRWFGVLADNQTDDTAAWQNCINAFGATTLVASGQLVPPMGGTSVISDTILFDRKAIFFNGPGVGTSGNAQYGFAFRWNGVAGAPMFRIKRCQFLVISRVRFIGKSSAKPSCAIELLVTSGDTPINSNIGLEHIWIGGGLLDAVNTTAFTNGIVTAGDDQQNDQSYMRHIHIENVDDACIDITDPQNTLWHIDTVTLNNAACGIRMASRWVKVENISMATITNCYEIVSDGGMEVEEHGSEGCSRLLYSLSAQQFFIRGGYFQSSAASLPGDNAIINVSTLEFELNIEGFHFTRSGGGISAGQEKIKVRGSDLRINLAPSMVWVDDGLEIEHLDIDTSNAANTARVWWGKNAYFNYWVHGASVKLGARNDVMGNSRFMLASEFQGMDSAGATHLLFRYNEPALEVGSSTINNVVFKSDLTMDAGLDIKMANNRAIYFKNASGVLTEILSYNSSNQIEIGGAVYTQTRGSMYRTGDGDTFSATGSPVTITGWGGSNGTNSGVTTSTTNGTLTVGAAEGGDYLIWGDGKWYVQSGDGDTVTVTVDVVMNDVIIGGFVAYWSVNSAGDGDTFSFQDLVTVPNSAVIKMRVTVTTEGGATVFVLPHGHLGMLRRV